MFISNLPRSLKARVAASPFATRLAGDAAWVAAGQMVSGAAMLAGMRELTELVRPEVFGTLSLLLGMIALGSNLVCSPLLQAAIRFYPDFSRNNTVELLRKTVQFELLRCIFVMAIIILFVGMLISAFLHWRFLGFIIVAAILAAETFFTFEMSLLSAARRQKLYALLTALEGITRPLLAIVAVIAMGPTALSVMLGYLMSTSLLLTIAFMQREKTGFAHAAARNTELRLSLWRYALPLAPLAITGWVTSVSDRYVIEGFLGLEKVGIYASVYSVASRLMLWPAGIIGQTLRPVYFDAVSSNNKELEKKAFRSWLIAVALCCMCIEAACYFFKERIMTVLVAEKYRAGQYLLPLIAAGYAMFLISNVFSISAHAYRKTRWNLIIASIGAVANIIFGVPLIWAYGMLGAAIAVPLYYGLQMLASMYAYASITGDQRSVVDNGL